MRWALEEQISLYTAAHGLYEQGDYAKAAELFTELVLANAYAEKYWRGLAAAHQMNGAYKEALHAWCLVALLASKDPSPHFHAAECLLSLEDREEGAKALNAAEELLGSDEASKQMRSKINLLRSI